MSIEAELPDGTVLEFPDGTDEAVIQRVVKQQLGVADGAPSPQQDAPGQDAPGPAEPAPRRAKRDRNVFGEVAGFMANVNRNLGIGDELAAAGGTVVNHLTGRGPQGWSANLDAQRGLEDDFKADRPSVAALGSGIGNAATALVPMGQTGTVLAQGARGVNALRAGATAALTGAGYAAADRGSLDERFDAATNPGTLALSGVLGAGVGAIGPAARRAKRAGQKDGDILADVGISTSIPQRMGRAAKGVEDLLKRFPITGQAMAGYQDRQIGQLNRAVALKALEPIGAKLPRDIKPGFDMVQYVDDALGAVYSQAAKLAPRVKLDEQLVTDAAKIAERRVDLGEAEAAQFDRIIKDRLMRLQSGEASGEMVKKIHGELGGLQAEAARKGSATLAGMLGDTRRAMMGLIERTNPKAGTLIRRADEGWGIYSIMNDAAAAASARGGVFLPGQLNTQVRASAKAMGSNMAGKGRGRLQDIATAASRTIPDSYGNPGTANAGLLAGGGWGAITDPTSTAVAATALGATATPYLLMGRKILEELPTDASRSQLQAVGEQLAELATKDPGVRDLQRQLAVRLAQTAGVSGAAAAAPGGVESIEVGGQVYWPDGRVTAAQP